MGFKSDEVSKLQYASFLAASLAYLSHRQRDRVGIVTFDEEVVTHVPPSAKHFNVLLHTLDRSRPERPGRLLAMLDKLAEHFKRRSIVALISDLYENPADLMEALKPYRSLGNDVIVFHVLDPAEITFPVHRGVALPGSGKRGRSARRAGGVRGAVPADDARAHRGADGPLLGVAHRLHAAHDLAAARRGAVHVPGQPRAADAGAVTGMSFLAPLFFAGLAAIAVPILVHLIQRERKNIVEFPSLMFIRQIPYQSVERRRIHNWLLLLMRITAMVLLIAAFSRPFFHVDPVKAAAALSRRARGGDPARSVREHGLRRSLDSARRPRRKKVARSIGGADKATLVLFGTGSEEAVRATGDWRRLERPSATRR